MQEQIFLGHFKEAHSMKASHHPREPSTKIAAVLYQLSYEDPFFSKKPIFLLLFLIREENETWNKDNVNCRNTRYDRHSCNSILSNCKLTQINLRSCNAIPPLFWLWSWIPIEFLRQYEIQRKINVCLGRCGWTLCLMFLLAIAIAITVYCHCYLGKYVSPSN